MNSQTQKYFFLPFYRKWEKLVFGEFVKLNGKRSMDGGQTDPTL